ncbi:MAG: hypothetical protein ABI040_10060 [Rhodoferax sp.]
MFLVHRYLFFLMWLGWFFYWGVAAGDVKATVKRESVRSRLAHIVPLLLALVGTAVARAELRGIVAVALAIWALWRKLRLEERWMREQSGEDYEAYSRRVAALVPFAL